MTNYNNNIFVLEPQKSKNILEQRSGLFAEHHQNYYIFNVGNTEIEADVLEGLLSLAEVDKEKLKPGEGTILQLNPKKEYRKTVVEITNLGAIRALVHGSVVTGYDEIDPKEHRQIPINNEDIRKTLLDVGPVKRPQIGRDFSQILNFYLPLEGKCVWETLNDQILKLVDNESQKAIKSAMTGSLKKIKDEIVALNDILKKEELPPSASEDFMDVAEKLINLEKKFIIPKTNKDDYLKANFTLLPLYSITVDFKVAFLQFGQLNSETLMLNDDQIERLQKYGKKLISDPKTGAINHVKKISSDKISKLYNTVYEEAIFEEFYAARAYLSLGGLEHIVYWETGINDPTNIDNPYTTSLVLSNYFGKPTPKLLRQVVADDVQEPLKPLIANEKFVNATEIQVSVVKSEGSDEEKIAGLTFVYEDGHSVTTGYETDNKHSVNVKNKIITSLTAWGQGQLHGLTFNLDDGSSEEIGSQNGDSFDFELPNHHIIGLFISNDDGAVKAPQNQAVNILAAYQVIPVLPEDTTTEIEMIAISFTEGDLQL